MCRIGSESVIAAVTAIAVVCVSFASYARSRIVLEAPCHVFTEAEVPVAAGGVPGAGWKVLDWRGRDIGVSGRFDAAGKAKMPLLPAGYYRIGEASFAVVPVPERRVFDPGSFYGVDSAQSWVSVKSAFPCPWNGGDTFKTVSDAIRRAGIPHVRDRLSWAEVNKKPGELEFGKYMYNADLLHERGIDVSGTFHDCPVWASKLKKLPGNLESVYSFCRQAASDFGARMGAWEFWNEQELDYAAPEPVWDYAAALKAAYLGFKAGNASVPVLVGALSDGAVRPGRFYAPVLLENDASKYFDVFNYHTYSPIADYPRLISAVRDMLKRHGAGGRAVWVTESGTYLEGPAEGVSAIGKGKSHSPGQELVVAEFYAKSQIAFQMQGVSRDYLFVFGVRNEGGGSKDFGVLRHDGTVKPVYAAISAMTRELVSARIAGELRVGKDLRAYLFNQPDGSQTVAFWAVSPMDRAMRGVVSAEPDFRRGFRLRCGSGGAGRFRLSDMCGMVSSVSGKDGVVSLEATRFPSYLSGLRGLVADVPARPVGVCGATPPADDEDLTVVLRVDLSKDDFEIVDSKTRARMKGESGRLRVQVWNLGEKEKTGRVTFSGCVLEGLPEKIVLAPRGGGPVSFDCVLRPESGTSALPVLTLTGVFDGKRSSRLVMPVLIPDRLFGDSEYVPLQWREKGNWKMNDSAGKRSFTWDEKEKAWRFEFVWENPRVDRWFYPVYAFKRPMESMKGALAMQFEVKSRQDRMENDYLYNGVHLLEPGRGERHYLYGSPMESWEKRTVVFGTGDALDGVGKFRIGGNPRGMKCTYWVRNVTLLKKPD